MEMEGKVPEKVQKTQPPLGLNNGKKKKDGG